METRGKYQFWLCDDQGNRLSLLDGYSFFSYSRSCIGFGTIEIGLPHRMIVRPSIFFQPDWRIDVWRRSSEDTPFRRECSFLLRKYTVYQRASDGTLMIIYYGRSPIDILRRFGAHWLTLDGPTQRKDDGSVEDYTYYWDTSSAFFGTIRDMMHELANGTFTPDVSVVEEYRGYLGSGKSFYNDPLSPGIANYYTYGQTVLDILTELRQTSVSQNEVDPTQSKVYFDVVEIERPVTGTAPAFQYEFRTYIGLRGVDRTENGVVFSPENGNVANPVLSEDWLDESNAIIVKNMSAKLAAVVYNPLTYTVSGMNKCYKFVQSSSGKTADLYTEARALLKKNERTRTISTEFIDSPGGPRQPRSLYGLDWDLGDKVNVRFIGVTIQTEILIVYVSMDEEGKENVLGRNEVGS